MTKKKLDKKKGKTKESRVKQYLAEFFDNMLQQIDGYLTDMGYVTGPNISIVDIMLYFEIYTICVMYRREIPS